jgi:NAD(P)-dependent dehydrogenase (short-subunit alcohol dehydrogenase family)
MTHDYSLSLEGKVALITGASRGIGRECALLFGAKGARVAVNYTASAEAAAEVVAEIGPENAFAVQANVGSPKDVESMVDAVIARFGTIDIVVNNAAVFALNPFDGGEYDRWVALWRRTLEVNLLGAANVAFLAMRHMRKKGRGKIINVASRAAWRGETEFADYGASKAGLVNLTKSIARACSRDGITATCVAPGFVATDMANEEIERNGAEIIGQVPMGRVGTVQDVAGVVLFCATSMADYLNGATLDVNGGSYVR